MQKILGLCLFLGAFGLAVSGCGDEDDIDCGDVPITLHLNNGSGDAALEVTLEWGFDTVCLEDTRVPAGLGNFATIDRMKVNPGDRVTFTVRNDDLGINFTASCFIPDATTPTAFIERFSNVSGDIIGSMTVEANGVLCLDDNEILFEEGEE